MMSKKKWFVLLCAFVGYLLMGASIYHNIESQEESKRMVEDMKDRQAIEEAIKHLPAFLEDDFFDKLSEYCEKPLGRNMTKVKIRRRWDFYHSLFFVITVVSTIGYGNLAPTTMFGRIFMIFYGLVGIPLNGIVMVTLGGYFGRSFTKLYHRWKSSKMMYDTTRLGLISQIILYLVPGFTFFIFLPGAIMVIFEGWAYDVAVYYSFVTLTTIGFGDYVAGVNNVHEFSESYYLVYQIFLLVWVIGGLGYVVMILNFITQAMRSKQIKELEHIITENIKKTPVKIRHELRSLLQEFLFMRVKPVYKGEFEYTPTVLERTQSCPDLTIYGDHNSPLKARKRAFSECPRSFMLQRVQSDTDLENIDKDRTFDPNNTFMVQQQRIRQVLQALDNLEPNHPHAYDNLPDEEILASEKFNSRWSFRSHTPSMPPSKRRRAVSEIKIPPPYDLQTQHENTWYGQEAAKNWETFKTRNRTFSVPTSTEIKPTTGFFARIKNKLIPTKETPTSFDVEKQELPPPTRRASTIITPEERYIRQTSRGRVSVLSTSDEAVLEQTSIADLMRAISALTTPDIVLPSTSGPKRKMGTAGISPPKHPPPSPRTRRLAIRPNGQSRRSSLMPEVTAVQKERRRFSLRPVDENLLMPPPPYSSPPPSRTTAAASRKFSRIPTTLAATSASPVKRQVNKKEKDDNS